MKEMKVTCNQCKKIINPNAIWSTTILFESSLLKLSEQLHFCTFEEMADFLCSKLPSSLENINTY